MVNVYSTKVKNFVSKLTFDCGQCFRFEKRDNYIDGVALGKYIRITQNDDSISIEGIDENEYENVWKYYLDLDEDYETINDDILNHFGKYNDTISKAIDVANGIRILRQDHWEALCSFIISQNNNSPRIKKIVNALCETLGETIEYSGNTYYSFPSPQVVYEAGIDKLNELRMGFRSKYVFDAAKKIVEGTIDLKLIESMEFDEAEKYLMQIFGVGKKVADCTLLYGYHKTEAFPVDVWIKRVIEKYYPCGIDLNDLGKYAGIAQQYLFFYERYTQKDGM
ncbi:MAG: DNA-3-methyladenine glycosylase 2 family protein [Clostridia bacterium]|nr:DNA-3-methyladenine glycosylase 2 family protein [Clostridia bacterium]